MKTFDVTSWVQLFRDIGLDEEAMHRWHSLFEQQWPIQHQSFLEWLNVSPEAIARIRWESRYMTEAD